MRFKKVLLVNPPYSRSRVRTIFSAGLGYVAQTLKTAGIAYDVLDMSLGYSYRDLAKRVKYFAPDLVGFSVMTYRYKETYGIINALKKDFPGISIAAGGPHISLFRDDVLAECQGLDYGVVLEGEETLVELCAGSPLEAIKGLVFRNSRGVVYNGDRAFIRDLDSLSLPTYEKFELERSINRAVNALPIVSSRGCPFDCMYCPVKCSIGEVFRMRSPESIIKELRYWQALGYDRFSFADDNFTLVRERVKDLCGLIIKEGLKLKLSCDNGIRADRVDRELLTTMKEAGFYRIAFGVEAGNNKILKRLNKKEDIETITQRIQEACDLGYDVDLFFLVGSPGETRKDLEDSFKLALKFPIGVAYFYNIIPFPHTPLFDWVKTHGRFLEDHGTYLDEYPILDNRPLFETQEMSRGQRRKALKDAFSITRKTMRMSWNKRLLRLGFFGKILSWIYTTAFVQDVVLRNRTLRSWAYKMAHAFVS
ncbi:MAG: radical SAM protein [Candidatus Omnitrophica bacterium]|nr:radical SAM protein [Candidatus Omnitrophota bacterium]